MAGFADAALNAAADGMGQPDHVINLGPGGHTDTPLANVDSDDLVAFIDAGLWQ